MPKLTAHPGVSIVCPHPGYPFQLSFTHPLLRKQVKRSSRSTDGAAARDYAIELSAILRNPDSWETLPEKTSEVIRSIWKGDAIDDALVNAVATVVGRALCPNPKPGQILIIDPEELRAGKAITEAEKATNEINRLQRELLIAQKKIDNLTALLRKFGHEATVEYRPKTLEQAIKDFLSEDKSKAGTNAGPRKKKSYKAWLNGLAKSLDRGKASLVHEISARHVIEDLSAHLKSCTQEVVKKRGSMLCKFLEHQTNGTFKPFTVKSWIKQHCNQDTGDIVDPLWLDENQVNAMLAEMSDYWKQAAMVQWAGAFRPEELAHLQTEKVFLNGDIRIEVCPLRIDGKLVWKPKTKQSYGRVHLPEFSRATISTLLAIRNRSIMLFPDDPVLHAGTTPRKAGSEKRWLAERFCTAYLTALRTAATSANENNANIDLSRLDGRTLRRSAGKRILISCGFDLNRAAACLRDTPETVRKHYARILPDDVTQPDQFSRANGSATAAS